MSRTVHDFLGGQCKNCKTRIADQQDYYPYTVTKEDNIWIWITFWFYPFLIFSLICFGALLDF